MAGAKTRSKTEKDRCKRYETYNTYGKNKRAKVARHAKNHPNDSVAAQALKSEFICHKKAPKATHWSKSDIYVVGLYKKFGKTGNDFLADKNARKKNIRAEKSSKPE